LGDVVVAEQERADDDAAEERDEGFACEPAEPHGHGGRQQGPPSPVALGGQLEIERGGHVVDGARIDDELAHDGRRRALFVKLLDVCRRDFRFGEGDHIGQVDGFAPANHGQAALVVLSHIEADLFDGPGGGCEATDEEGARQRDEEEQQRRIRVAAPAWFPRGLAGGGRGVAHLLALRKKAGDTIAALAWYPPAVFSTSRLT